MHSNRRLRVGFLPQRRQLQPEQDHLPCDCVRRWFLQGTSFPHLSSGFGSANHRHCVLQETLTIGLAFVVFKNKATPLNLFGTSSCLTKKSVLTSLAHLFSRVGIFIALTGTGMYHYLAHGRKHEVESKKDDEQKSTDGKVLSLLAMIFLRDLAYAGRSKQTLGARLRSTDQASTTSVVHSKSFLMTTEREEPESSEGSVVRSD